MKYCPNCRREYPDPQQTCLDDGVILSLRDPYYLVGRTLVKKYRIDALIGIGGMGAVYSANHLRIDRHVALKILLPNLALGNERMINLFEREAKLAGRLSHENIVNIIDAGHTDDEIAYIAMEWLDGNTLEADLVKKGVFSFERTLEIIRQIAAALEEAHDKNIIHLDLKPSNVMLVKRRDGRDLVKVVDFGIGKALSNTAGSFVSSVMGTPHYSSPEQSQLGARIDARSDIYSLGVMIFQMLTGVRPFNVSSAQELIRLQIESSPPPLRQLRPEAPVAIEQLLSRMLAKDPKQRPQRASVVHELFAQALNCKEQPQTKIRLAEEKPLVGEKLERRLVVVPIGSANQPADSSLQKGQAETGDKNSATLVAAKTPKTYKDRGVAYLDKGDYGRAIADLSKAIELKPDYADAYHDRGVAYRRKGDYDLAIADYSKAIELRPDYAFYYHARGDAYRGRGDYDRANADLSRAIELEPSRRAVVDPNIWTPF